MYQPVCWQYRGSDAIAELALMSEGQPYPVEILRLRGDVFDVPVLVTSDLRDDAATALDRLEARIGLRPSDCHVVTCGDMAGTGHFGEAATPARVSLSNTPTTRIPDTPGT